MLRSSRIREIFPFLAFIFLQVHEIQSENDFDYFLESPSLLTTSEIAEEIMNQNLNLNCAGLREFLNSETYQDVEKILNATGNSTKVNGNREEYHFRIKRCTEIERQNKILREFEKQNRKNEFVKNRKSDKGHLRQKHSKNNNILKTTTEELSIKDYSGQDEITEDVLRGDLAEILKNSESTEPYSRTYRTIAENPSQFTTSSASSNTFFTSDQKMGQDAVKNQSETPSSMKSVHQKNTPEMKSTTSENEEKNKKGLLKSLLGDIRKVMEGGTLKNIEDSSHSKFKEKSSSEEVTDEEKLLEYETVTPHKFPYFGISQTGQKITAIPHSSTTEYQIHDEAKKQLQAKMKELVRIRRKMLEIARLVNVAKNQTQIIPSPAFNGTSIKNENEAKEEAETSRKKSKNQKDLKSKFDKVTDLNRKEAENDSTERQTTYDPLSTLTTNSSPNSKNFMIEKQITENLPYETRKSSFLKTHDPSENLSIQQSNLFHLTTELPPSKIPIMKHDLLKHEGHSNQHILPLDSSQNGNQNSFPSAKLQDVERKQTDEDFNSQKASKIGEHFTKTTPSRLDSTINPIHIHITQFRNEKDAFISKSPTKIPRTTDETTESIHQSEENAVKMERSRLNLNITNQNSHHLTEFVKRNETFSKSTSSPTQNLNLKKNETSNPLHHHVTSKNVDPIDTSTSQSIPNFAGKTSSKEHLVEDITSHFPHDMKKYPKLVSVTSKWPESKTPMPFQQEKSSEENATFFDHHSTKITTFQPLSGFGKIDLIPTQLSLLNNSVSESNNKSEVSSEIVGKPHEEPQKSHFHTVNSNSDVSSHFEKLLYHKLIDKLEKLKENIEIQKQNLGKISTLRPDDTSMKVILAPKYHTVDHDPSSLHHHKSQPHLDKISTHQSHPGNQHSHSSHSDKTSIQHPQSFEESTKGVTVPIKSHSENHLVPKPVDNHKELAHSEKISTLHPSHSINTPAIGTITPPNYHKNGISSHEEHSHPHSIHSEISKGIILPQKSHENNLIRPLVHYHSTHQPLIPLETSKGASLPHTFHMENHSTQSHSLDTSPKRIILPQKSHSESPSSIESVHHHHHSDLLHSEKFSTLQPTLHLENTLIPGIHHSTLHPSSSFEISKETISPHKSLIENHSEQSHPLGTSSKEVTSSQKSHRNSLIPQQVHHHQQHSELPHFERMEILHPTHPTQMSTRGISPKSDEEISWHLNGISSYIPVIPTKQTTESQISTLDHLMSQINHQHTHLHNLDKIFTHLASHSTEAFSTAPTSAQALHKDNTILHPAHPNKSQKLLPESKPSHLPIEIGSHHQHIPQLNKFPTSTTKLPELHLETKIPHSPTQVKILHHSTIDNTALVILEEIKRAEREKIEEIKNFHKKQIEDLPKNRINISSLQNHCRHPPNNIHATDGTSPIPKTLKHEAESRSGTGQEIKIPKSHDPHDITKPYPTSPTTFGMLQTDFDVLGKYPKPLPPLNPNDNWKFAEKLDNYYEKEKQIRRSTTSRPWTVHPTTKPTLKPQSTTIAPTTAAPRVRPSISENSTRGQNHRTTSTAKPPTQKPSHPVNYNINSTINRNYNITINLVPPNSAPQENHEGDEDQMEGNSVGEDEPDPFTALARPTEVSQKSNQDPAGDFDSLPHISLSRQSSLNFSNSLNMSLLNETTQLPNSTTTFLQVGSDEPVPFPRTEITPSDESLQSYSFENKDTILQSQTPSITKSPHSSTSATTPHPEIMKKLKRISKVQHQPYSETIDYSTRPPITPSDKINCSVLTQTIPADGNIQQRCQNIIIIPNKTEEIIEILRLLNTINANNNELPSTDPSILQAPRLSQVELTKPNLNHLSEIKSLLKSIRKSTITPEETIELRKSISELLKILKQRRIDEYNKLYILKANPMVGDGRDSIQTITQINEYVELLELMTVYLARDPNKLLDDIKDARFDNFESPYPHDDPQRRLIEDQFYYVHPKILNEFIDVYKKYSKDESYFGKPTWQFSEENGPRRVPKQRSFGNSLNNLFHFKELIPALTYNRASMYGPGIRYESY